MPVENSMEKHETSSTMDTANEPHQKRKQSEISTSDQMPPEVQSHKRPRAQDEHDLDESSPKCTIGDSIERMLSGIPNSDDLECARNNLDGHIQETSAMFFLELTPSSIARGATCRLSNCDRKIHVHTYRVAVYPGMFSVHKSSDFYHVECFEKLADFSKKEYLKRLQPLTRSTYALRGIKSTSAMDGNFLLDGGAERLVLQWIHSMEGLLAKRDKIQQKALDSDLENLLLKAGSATFSPKKPKAMSEFEFSNLSDDLAPIESDGPEDREEWNLFDNYLPLSFDDPKDLAKRHTLSFMLDYWRAHKFLANADVDSLSDTLKEARTKLSGKAIKGIQRLSAIPMPDFQSALGL